MSKEKLLVSVSGGKTSTYMSWFLYENYKDEYEMSFVFANVGKEREETLVFMNQFEKAFNIPVTWVEADVKHGERKGTSFRIVNFETASRNGEPYEEIIKKYGIPNKAFPHCTRELKTRPIHAYIKSIGWTKYKTAIGIRSDEMDRINFEAAVRNNYWYPLADNNIDKRAVDKFWSQQSFNLNLKPYEGNCDFCWKKSIKKLRQIAKDNPKVMDWWRDMEVKYADLVPLSRKDAMHKPPFYFGRGGKPVDLLLLGEVNQNQLDLFEYGCSETCEPF